MDRQFIGVVFCAILGTPALAQQAPSYEPPRTADGRPDLTGNWDAPSLTLLERPAGVPGLVLPPQAEAQAVSATLANFPEVIDPDIPNFGPKALGRVGGEIRSSVIVAPANGQYPLTARGQALVERLGAEMESAFDNPEERPLMERCLGGTAWAPLRGFIGPLPRRFVQTKEHFVIYAEDPSGARIVPLGEDAKYLPYPVTGGSSVGHWEGDTLVIETAGMLGAYPGRFNVGRPLAMGPDTRIVERLTRVADDEIVVEFEVEDRALYTQPWRGEVSFYRLDKPVFEYGCHEGNYSMEAMLVGNQAAQAAQAAGQ
jgi:hypothetical protein